MQDLLFQLRVLFMYLFFTSIALDLQFPFDSLARGLPNKTPTRDPAYGASDVFGHETNRLFLVQCFGID